MDNIMNLKKMLAYIEDNLDKSIDIADLAQRAGVSVYEFRRIFSFLVGMPIGEYLRKRRLSRAALDLIEGATVTEVSQRYGYDAPSSFSRAFKEFHGFAPFQIKSRKVKLLTPADLEIAVSQGVEIPYTITEDTAYTVCGYYGTSDLSDTECCENVWGAFYEPANAAVQEACGDEIYAVYYNEPNSVSCLIGARDTAVTPAECREIPAAQWACFEMIGSDDARVNSFYSDILLKWFHSCGYERDDRLPNVEVYPADMDADDFRWEIRIPVKPKGA